MGVVKPAANPAAAPAAHLGVGGGGDAPWGRCGPLVHRPGWQGPHLQQRL